MTIKFKFVVSRVIDMVTMRAALGTGPLDNSPRPSVHNMIYDVHVDFFTYVDD